MLQQIPNLPNGIIGVEAKGRITGEDYEKVLLPLVKKAHEESRHIRFLYRVANDFTFTPGAAWEDFQFDMKYMRLFERCAAVTDVGWLTNAVKIFAPMFPCPIKTFKDAQMDEAIAWLTTKTTMKNMLPTFLVDREVLLVEVEGPLRKEDFDALAAEVDPLIERKSLLGIVIHTKRFPGWEDLGSFFRHMGFVGAHHRKIKRVAVAVDGLIPEAIPSLAKYFVKAELKHFPARELEDAITWASAGGTSKVA